MRKVIIDKIQIFKTYMNLLKKMGSYDDIKFNFNEDSLNFNFVNNNMSTSISININENVIKDYEADNETDSIIVKPKIILDLMKKVKTNNENFFICLKNNKMRMLYQYKDEIHRNVMENQKNMSELVNFIPNQKYLEQPLLIIKMDYDYLFNSISMILSNEESCFLTIRGNQNEIYLNSTKKDEHKILDDDIIINKDDELVESYEFKLPFKKEIILDFYNDFLKNIKKLKPDSIEVMIFEDISLFKVYSKYGEIKIYSGNKKDKVELI